MRRWMLLILLGISACAPQENIVLPTADALESNTAPTQEVLQQGGGNEATDANDFTATAITGGGQFEITGPGQITCDATTLAISNGGTGDTVTISLEPGIAPGEYTLGVDDNTYTADIIVDGIAYNNDVFGLVTIDLVPQAAEDPVSGSFDLNGASSDDNVNVNGTFSFIAATGCP